MDRKKLLQRLISLFCISVFFSSCFTASVMDKAALDRKPGKIKEVHSAYFDSSHKLVVNFRARFDGKQRYQPYHLKVNVDTAIYRFRQSRSESKYLATKEETAQSYLTRISRIWLVEEQKKYMGIEYNKQSLKEGFLLADTFVVLINTSIYSDKDFSTPNWLLGKDSTKKYYTPKLNARFSNMVIEPDSLLKAKMGNADYGIAIHIEPSQKKKYIRHLLLPGAVIADIVTFPIQVIIAIKILSKTPIS